MWASLYVAVRVTVCCKKAEPRGSRVRLVIRPKDRAPFRRCEIASYIFRLKSFGILHMAWLATKIGGVLNEVWTPIRFTNMTETAMSNVWVLFITALAVVLLVSGFSQCLHRE